MTTNRDIAAAREYHLGTNHTEARLRSDAYSLDFDNQPVPFKVYPDLEPIPLPQSFAQIEVPTFSALGLGEAENATNDGAEHVPSLEDLARVLYLGAGVLRRRRHARGETFFRSYANTGALYHIDLYIVCGDIPGLDAGVYHFSPHDFALRRLRAGDYRSVLADASGDEPRVAHAPVTLVSASTYWRNAWKYRSRTYRHCFWDAGTMHANVLAVADTAGLQPRVVMGFADRPVEDLLGLDPAKEGALTLVPLGRTREPVPAPPAVDPLQLATLPLSPHEIDYPPVREVHAACSLAVGDDARAWRAARPAFPPTPSPAGQVFPLAIRPDGDLPTESLDAAIRRRGSTRQFDPTFTLSLEYLSTILASATTPVPMDCFGDGCASLLDLYLIVTSVEGLPPGAYRYHRATQELELLKDGMFRNEAGRLGLFQELPAAAAVNLYTLTDLETVLDAFGNRGYRAAQMEGGIIGGRMYLGAYAQHFGATGLTFLDDEVVAFFSPSAAGKSVMFLTALGRTIRKQEQA